MQVTLRKANAIQEALNSRIREVRLDSSVEINEFQIPSEVIAQAYDRWTYDFEKVSDLNDCLFKIRKSVGKKNAECGISDVLADLARVNRDVRIFAEFTDDRPHPDYDEMNARLAKMRDSERTYVGDRIHTSCFDEADITDMQKRYREAVKVQQKLKDRLLELNVETKIDLDEDTVRILKDEDIL